MLTIIKQPHTITARFNYASKGPAAVQDANTGESRVTSGGRKTVPVLKKELQNQMSSEWMPPGKDRHGKES